MDPGLRRGDVVLVYRQVDAAALAYVDAIVDGTQLLSASDDIRRSIIHHSRIEESRHSKIHLVLCLRFSI